MAQAMQWLRRPREPISTRAFGDVGIGLMVGSPVALMAAAWLKGDPYSHDLLVVIGVGGLIGLGCILTAVIRLLALVRSELSAMTFVLYQVLKNPEATDETVSLDTYRHLRQRLGLD